MILLDLFVAIHNDMLRLGKYDANCRNMGATLKHFAWFRRGKVYFGHIGDTRPLTIFQLSVGSSKSLRTIRSVGWKRRKG